MGLIQCKACGALYRYEKEGCCPKCGAYNRPPKRERVNPDGTIQHMTDAAFEKRQHAQGKVCFEEKECHEKKECYEKKVCYEDQARQGSRRTVPQGNTAPKPTGPVPHSKFPQTQSTPVKSNSAGKEKKKLPIGCLIPLAFLGFEILAGVIAVIREVLSSLGF